MNSATIRVVFRAGRGSLKAFTKRNCKEVSTCSLNESGIMELLDVQKGDTIILEGISPSGGADIMIGLPTSPPSPSYYPVGLILDNYDVL